MSNDTSQTSGTQAVSGQIWNTIEPIPRKLIVRGKSGLDSDCLVAYEEGSSAPLWIVLGGRESCFVCGLGVRATQERESSDAFEKGRAAYWAGVLGGHEHPAGLSQDEILDWKAGWLAGFEEEWEER